MVMVILIDRMGHQPIFCTVQYEHHFYVAIETIFYRKVGEHVDFTGEETLRCKDWV